MSQSALRAVVALMLVATLVLVGCSSTNAPSSAAGSPAAAASASAAAEASTAAAASSSAEPNASTITVGGGANRWCLNTVQEASAALGQTVTAMLGADVPGLGGGCNYSAADGTPVLSLAIITSPSAATTLQGAKLTPGITSVSGVGDEAILVSQAGPFVIRKGNVVISMTIVPTGAMDAAKMPGAYEQLGKAAVERIPAS